MALRKVKRVYFLFNFFEKFANDIWLSPIYLDDLVGPWMARNPPLTIDMPLVVISGHQEHTHGHLFKPISRREGKKFRRIYNELILWFKLLLWDCKYLISSSCLSSCDSTSLAASTESFRSWFSCFKFKKENKFYI